MARVYFPEVVKVKKHPYTKPVIVYIDQGIEEFLDRRNPDSVKTHINQLYWAHMEPLLVEGRIDIDFLWQYDNRFMTDTWTIGHPDDWGSGGLVTARTYERNAEGIFVQRTDLGTTAQNGLIILGRESEYMLFGGPEETRMSLTDFLQQRPPLHPPLTNNDRFVLPPSN